MVMMAGAIRVRVSFALAWPKLLGDAGGVVPGNRMTRCGRGPCSPANAVINTTRPPASTAVQVAALFAPGYLPEVKAWALVATDHHPPASTRHDAAQGQAHDGRPS